MKAKQLSDVKVTYINKLGLVESGPINSFQKIENSIT